VILCRLAVGVAITSTARNRVAPLTASGFAAKCQMNDVPTVSVQSLAAPKMVARSILWFILIRQRQMHGVTAQ
jgi:hypothetical protein